MNEEQNENGKTMMVAMRLETKKLIAELSSDAYKIGDTLTDETLKRVSGADCRVGQSGYGYLQTAIRNVAKQHNIYWERIHGANAIKRLTPEEALNSTRRDREHIARKARWGVTKLRTIDTSMVDESQRSEMNASLAQLGTLAVFASGKASKALEARKAAAPVELSRLLEAMKS